jgi:hypothetical protein
MGGIDWQMVKKNETCDEEESKRTQDTFSFSVQQLLQVTECTMNVAADVAVDDQSSYTTESTVTTSATKTSEHTDHKFVPFTTDTPPEGASITTEVDVDETSRTFRTTVSSEDERTESAMDESTEESKTSNRLDQTCTVSDTMVKRVSFSDCVLRDQAATLPAKFELKSILKLPTPNQPSVVSSADDITALSLALDRGPPSPISPMSLRTESLELIDRQLRKKRGFFSRLFGIDTGKKKVKLAAIEASSRGDDIIVKKKKPGLFRRLFGKKKNKEVTGSSTEIDESSAADQMTLDMSATDLDAPGNKNTRKNVKFTVTPVLAMAAGCKHLSDALTDPSFSSSSKPGNNMPRTGSGEFVPVTLTASTTQQSEYDLSETEATYTGSQMSKHEYACGEPPQTYVGPWPGTPWAEYPSMSRNIGCHEPPSRDSMVPQLGSFSNMNVSACTISPPVSPSNSSTVANFDQPSGSGWGLANQLPSNPLDQPDRYRHAYVPNLGELQAASLSDEPGLLGVAGGSGNAPDRMRAGSVSDRKEEKKEKKDKKGQTKKSGKISTTSGRAIDGASLLMDMLHCCHC